MSAPTNIFYVDDDPDDQMLFSEAVLEIKNAFKANLKLYQAENGADFFDLIHKADVIPDITFLDINMPVKNGFECLAEIRADQKLKHRPVAMISTSEAREVISKSYSLGADKYIVKPFEFGALKLAIQECLQEFNSLK
jgi:CheY-like chemotaxis protein